MRIVLLPGLDGTGELFAPFVEALQTLAPAAWPPPQVIAYPPDQPLAYAGHESWVRERLPRDEPFALLAESFAGPLGLGIAADPPANLHSLILCCTFASNPLPAFGPLQRVVSVFPGVRVPPRWFAPLLYGGLGTRRLRDAYTRAMAKVSPKVLQSRVAAVLGVDVCDALARVRVPMLYLLGRRDRLVRRSAWEAIRQVRADVALVELNGPHFLLQTLPFPAAAAVIEFLDSVRAPEHAATIAAMAAMPASDAND